MQPAPRGFPGATCCGAWLRLARYRRSPGSAQGGNAPRPNIVLFLSDDMGWKEAGFNGNKEVPTLTMNSIAREGVKLTQFYVQPVCSPSRSCLMTGRYPWKTGMERRPTGVAKQGMLLDERTIARSLCATRDTPPG